MSTTPFNKEKFKEKFNEKYKDKYLQILKSEGISKALTQLQKDTDAWELESFEGDQGYQPEMWKQLEFVRTFSRELWELALQTEK